MKSVRNLALATYLLAATLNSNVNALSLDPNYDPNTETVIDATRHDIPGTSLISSTNTVDSSSSLETKVKKKYNPRFEKLQGDLFASLIGAGSAALFHAFYKNSKDTKTRDFCGGVAIGCSLASAYSLITGVYNFIKPKKQDTQ